MTAITYRLDHIANNKTKAPLYYCPPGQCSPMPALITLDQSGEVYAYHRQCDGTPADELDGRTLTWRVDPQVSGKWLAEWLQAVTAAKEEVAKREATIRTELGNKLRRLRFNRPEQFTTTQTAR